MSATRDTRSARRLPLKTLAIGAGAMLGFAALGWTVAYVLDAAHFPVRRVYFEGPFQHVGRDDALRAVTPVARGNYFLADLDGLKEAMEALPWVQRASARRRWPDALEVRFSEQHLVARWDADTWLNAQAELVRLPAAEVPANLPHLSGPAGTQAQVLAQYGRFVALLGPAQQGIAGLELSSRRTWTLTLDNGVVVVVGREQPEARVARFARVWGETLAGQAEAIKQVDLHYTNGFSVEWRGGALRERALQHHKG